jgi:hypothetical protein
MDVVIKYKKLYIEKLFNDDLKLGIEKFLCGQKNEFHALEKFDCGQVLTAHLGNKYSYKTHPKNTFLTPP